VFDETARTTIFRMAPSFNIEDRYTRTIAFRSYLDQAWYDASFPVSYLDVPQIFAAQQGGFNSVAKFIKKGPSRKLKFR